MYVVRVTVSEADVVGRAFIGNGMLIDFLADAGVIQKHRTQRYTFDILPPESEKMSSFTWSHRMSKRLRDEYSVQGNVHLTPDPDYVQELDA